MSLSANYLTPSSSLSITDRPAKCMICDRPAHGFHCDVATCKGCKTFFRRQLLSEREVICNLNKDCYDLKKRRTPLFRCQACRFEKCFFVGMNPSLLVLRCSSPPGPIINHSMRRIISTETTLPDVIEWLTHLELKVENFRRSAYNPNWQEIRKVEDLLKNTNKLSLADSYGPFPGWPVQCDPALKVQNNYFQYFSPDRKHWWFFNLLTIVENIKAFSIFQQLDLWDQLILIRHVSVGLTTFHISYFTVSNTFQLITQPDGSQHPHRSEEGYQTVSSLIGPLYRIGIQHEEYLLLKAICICNPAIPDLSKSAQVLIDKERCLFSKILLDYCLRKRNDGPSRYVELIGILELVEIQQKKLRDIYLFSFGPVLAKLPKQYTISLIEDVFV